jgi:hypothetical protein
VSPTGLFLAEKYLPANMAVDLVAVGDRDRAEANFASIRHVRTMHAPGDETCFSRFEPRRSRRSSEPMTDSDSATEE